MSSSGSENRSPVMDTINEEIVSNFDDMDLRDELLRGIKDYGFGEPSAIQKRAIIPCIEGKDVLLEAKPGMGKTAAFVIAILQKINTLVNECQALILLPTRESAEELEEMVSVLANHLYVKCDVYTDATKIHENIRKLESGIHIVLGTADRIIDLIKRRALRTDQIKTLVLAETNRMLSDGLRDQIFEIQRVLNQKYQLILSMEDMSEEVSQLIKHLMREPLVIKEELTVEDIDQIFVPILKEELKIQSLCEMLCKPGIMKAQAVVFCNYRKKVELITQQLQKKNIEVCSVNSGMDWKQRQRIYRVFRSAMRGVLVTSARIIDIPEVPMIINFDLPTKPDTYINRVEKLVHFGCKCGVVNFVVAKDVEDLHRIQTIYTRTVKPIVRGSAPNPNDRIPTLMPSK